MTKHETATRPTDSAHRIISTIGITCVVIGPVLSAFALASFNFGLMNPGGAPNLAEINRDWERMEVVIGLGSLGMVVLLIAVLTLAHAARNSTRLAATGAVLALLAIPSMLVNSAADLPYLAMRGLTESEALNSIGAHYTLYWDTQPAYSLFLLYPIAMIVLAIALYRAGTGPRWSALCVGLGALLPIGPITGIGALSVLPAALILIGGLRILLADRHPA